MDIITVQVASEDAGERLDAYLAENMDNLSRAYIQKLIVEELIKVGGKAVKSNYKIKMNDEILLNIPEPEVIDIRPEAMTLDVIYEDSDLVVLNKPVGLVVHPAHGHYSGTLVNGLLAHCQDLSGINGKLRPGIVHRIDKDTSGLLMVAKNDFAHRSLAQQLKDHTVERAYTALVQGVVSEPGGIIDAPIGRHESDRKKMAVVLKNAKHAITRYMVKERYAKCTLLDCQLETGRTHQIRVHLAYIGHPLVGDPVYGQRKNNLDFEGQALHAYSLGFVHPRTGETLHFEAPLPEAFQMALNRLSMEV